MKRLSLVVLVLWVARWAARELASYAGRRWLPPSVPSKESPRQPGLMPGPFD